MKKLLSMLWVSFFLLVLSGCQLFNFDHVVVETYDITSQYNHYLESDIADIGNYDQLINTIAEETIPATVRVKTIIKNALNITVEIRQGTGLIYEVFGNSLRVVTSYDLINVMDNQYTVSYEVYDYLNRSYTALVLSRSEELGLAKLKFDTNVSVARLRTVNFSRFIPLNGEPVMMISFYHLLQNSLTMGKIESYNESKDLYETSIDTDSYTLGGAVIDMRNQVIGLAVGTLENKVQVIGAASIKNYLNITD